MQDFRMEEMESIPAGENPFHHDAYNMGTRMGKNIMVMHHSHNSETARYIILVNTDTGARVRIRIAHDEEPNMHDW